MRWMSDLGDCRPYLVACLMAVTLVAGSAPVGAVEPISLVPPGSPVVISRAYFGMHIHSSDKKGHWPSVPFGSWRLWDSGTTWANLETRKGAWNFSVLDADVERAQNAGVEVLLVLAFSPPWASSRPEEPTYYAPGLAAEPRDMEDWRSYVRMVAMRYRGRIAAYQLWNEAADKPFYSGSMDKLIEMTRIAHDEIKHIDPAAIIVSPSSVGGEDQRLSWVRRFLDAGGGKYVDVVSYHLYHGRTPPESIVPWAKKLRGLLDAGGYRKLPLWNTESGYFVLDGSPRPEDKWQPYPLSIAVDSKQAGQYVVRDLLLARALGFDRYYFYAWDNGKMGFIEPISLNLRPAGQAFGQAVSLLMRSKLERCDRTGDGAWVCRLTLSNGRSAMALWRDPEVESVTYTVPFAGVLQRFDGGAQSAVALGDALILTADVVILVHEAPGSDSTTSQVSP